MNKKILLLSAVAVLGLTGCHGLKKVSFSEYQKEVNGLKDKDIPEIKQKTIKGKFADEKYSFKVTKDNLLELSAKEIAVNTIVSAINIYETALIKNDNATYYTLFGFKVKSDDGVMEFNKHGHLTLLKGEIDSKAVNLTISYKY